MTALPYSTALSNRDFAYTSVEGSCEGKWFCDLAWDWAHPPERTGFVRASTNLQGFICEIGKLDGEDCTIYTYLHNMSLGG